MRSPFTKEYSLFLEMLIAERKKADISQYVLADRLNTRQNFISKIETGERRLDVIEFLKIAKAIGFDPDKFVETLFSKIENNRKFTSF